MTENLDTLHDEEERLRVEHRKFVESKEDVRDHVLAIEEAMNVVYALTHDHAHRNDDELTIQFFGIRIFNLAGASIKLAYGGYYQTAFSTVRDLLETSFLLDYLVSNPNQISVWKTATKDQLKGVFGPNAVRNALDKRDGFKEGKRKEIYDLISHHATHATPSGFKLTVTNQLGTIGPFYSEDNFEAWVQELVKVMSGSGVVFGKMFQKLDPELTLTKAAYLEHLSGWKKKYFGGPNVWEQTK
jgi:hypothetical protein